jgi:hypothetical protein
MTVWVIISAVVLPLALSEFSEISPWAARHLLNWAAHRLGDPRACERYREEWLAGLNDVPGKLTKLLSALSIICYTVPVLHWRFKSTVYLWPARRFTDTFLAIIRPSVCRRVRERHMNHYTVMIGSHGKGGSSITAGLLIRLMTNAIAAAASYRVLPRSSRASDGGFTVELDHRHRHVVLHGLTPAPKRPSSPSSS